MLQTQEKNQTMDETRLLEELLLAVRDVFDCLIVQSGQKALLHFEEGVFCLSLQRLPTQDDA